MATEILGVLSMLTGAAINNLGIVLQKRQVNLKSGSQDRKGVSDIGSFVKDPVWMLGILMQTAFVLPFFLFALSLIGVTLAQPLSNSGIIVLVIGLVKILGEKLRSAETAGVFLLIAGMIAIGLGGVSGNVSQQSVLSPASSILLWFLVVSIPALGVLLAVASAAFARTRLITLGLLAGICYAAVSISMQILTVSLEDLSQSVGLMMLAYGLAGTLLGTVLGILTTQEAFKRGRGINIVPFMQLTMNMIPIAAGLLVFGQTLSQPLFFWLGSVWIIVGASLLARLQEQ